MIAIEAIMLSGDIFCLTTNFLKYTQKNPILGNFGSECIIIGESEDRITLLFNAIDDLRIIPQYSVGDQPFSTLKVCEIIEFNWNRYQTLHRNKQTKPVKESLLTQVQKVFMKAERKRLTMHDEVYFGSKKKEGAKD